MTAAKNPLVGVLALQGAFREHVAALARLGAATREVRQLRDMAGIDTMVIPGGESTTMGKLLTDLEMLEPLRARISGGMPVYGSCAGLILLCRSIEGSEQPRLGVLDAVVRRNAFGRQVDSFEADLTIPELGAEPLPAVFIRAPVILSTGPEVRVLARVEMDGAERAVAVRQGRILATSFHPELTPDTRFHRYFLDICRGAA
ncbi:pyridoxal 5'-phosphate synthase glutaminase subunit PdxT [uncultured Desulfovibrio sp.]|uniref:pyridoxal 5'-phosphate synthase glutaminase subunit PdxT n=1 Tax=uncultured Desulfovibrio sp. TaxID=167968 RepID=UPI0025F43F38|nr:pyridoxal 5'-phosphate synthase glutaminase subunit PdxT [uncultured Desulfovibrio sp.]